MDTTPIDSDRNILDPLLWEKEFLTWFAAMGLPLQEKRLSLGGFSYFQFSSAFETKSGRTCGAFGRSQDRRLAVIKCVAELVERKAMMSFFDSPENRKLLPASFHTSNGWAVHLTATAAKKRSYLEALERHLLLKSYILHGWAGFKLVDKIKTPELELFFLSSCFVAGDLVSGIVAAKSDLYAGVSFGYCIGSKDDLGETHFWESALFESVDKILCLQGQSMDLTEDPSSWLRAETKKYLETPFDLAVFESGVNTPVVFEAEPLSEAVCIDLALDKGLSFPLFAAFSWGKGLIPLFHKGALQESDLSFLNEIFKANGLENGIPERHPIL